MNRHIETKLIKKAVKGGYIGYDVPGFDINKNFYEIRRKDFQGAISQAGSFSDKYLRTLAVPASVKDCEKNEETVKPKAKTK